MNLALVTGASGFAGSHLVEHLIQSGIPTIGWTRRDVDLLDRDAVRARIRDLRPSMIYHCAGAPHVAHSWAQTAETLAANVLSTHYLLDAVRRAGFHCRMLIPGSAMVYRSSHAALSEDDPVGPASPYGLSKLAQEQLGARSREEDKIDVILTRAFNHTGPRQDPSFVAPGLARQLALIESGRAEPIIRVGNLDTRRDLSDVRDTVRAYRLLMECGRPGVPYNVCSGHAVAIRELLDGLRRRVRIGVTVEVDPALLRPSDAALVVGNPSRLQIETGWSPAIPFDQMLDDLLNYWRNEIRRS